VFSFGRDLPQKRGGVEKNRAEAYDSRESRGESHLQIPFETEQGRNKNVQLRGLSKQTPIGGLLEKEASADHSGAGSKEGDHRLKRT
jgi:hypothetical protein